MRKGYAIGQLIRELRKANGLTQSALSELVGVSYQQIQKYEKSGDNISVERLKQIANALGTPITLFFTPGAEAVGETPAVYGKMADDERLLLQLFRNIKNKKTKKAVLEFIRTMAAR